MRADRGRHGEREKTFPVFNAKNAQVNWDFEDEKNWFVLPRVQLNGVTLGSFPVFEASPLEMDALLDTIAQECPSR